MKGGLRGVGPNPNRPLEQLMSIANFPYQELTVASLSGQNTTSGGGDVVSSCNMHTALRCCASRFDPRALRTELPDNAHSLLSPMRRVWAATAPANQVRCGGRGGRGCVGAAQIELCHHAGFWRRWWRTEATTPAAAVVTVSPHCLFLLCSCSRHCPPQQTFEPGNLRRRWPVCSAAVTTAADSHLAW